MDAKYSAMSLADEKIGYAESEASTSTLLNDEQDFSQPQRRRSSILNSTWLLLGHALMFTFSLSILLRGLLYTTPSTLKYVKEYSAYSPAAIAVEYEEVKFNGSMYAQSKYMGASPEVDAAWDEITYKIGDQMISAEELKKIDKPDTVIKVTDPKTGKEGYRVGIEVFHQLHCLNLLRQVSFWDYYSTKGGDFEEGLDGVRMHIDHCLEMLRMNLMCQSDIGLITFHEVPGEEDIWPDFSTWHTCRNFEKVVEWAMDNTVANDDIF